MQKSPLQRLWQIYFSIKSYSTFSAKMFQVPSFGSVYYIWYTVYLMVETVDFIPYKVENVGKKKKNVKAWRNEVDIKTVKIATSEIHFSILKRNFTIL